MKLLKQKITGVALATLLVLSGCEDPTETYKDFIKEEVVYLSKPKVSAVPSAVNKVKFFVKVNPDPKLDSVKVLNVTNQLIYSAKVDQTALKDDMIDFSFEVPFEDEQEGSQTFRVMFQDKDRNKSLPEEVVVSVLGRRYEANLLIRKASVAVGGKGVILDWGDTLATSSASFIAYTNTADQAMTVEVPKKVEREGEEVSNNQTILTNVKPGSTLEVYTTYKPSEEGGVFRSQAKEYPVNAPVITSISPLQGGEGTEVTITGENFHPTAAENTVLFGTVEVTPSKASVTSLTVTVPKITLGDHAITMKVGAATIPGQTFKVTAKE